MQKFGFFPFHSLASLNCVFVIQTERTLSLKNKGQRQWRSQGDLLTVSASHFSLRNLHCILTSNDPEMIISFWSKAHIFTYKWMARGHLHFRKGKKITVFLLVRIRLLGDTQNVMFRGRRNVTDYQIWSPYFTEAETGPESVTTHGPTGNKRQGQERRAWGFLLCLSPLHMPPLLSLYSPGCLKQQPPCHTLGGLHACFSSFLASPAPRGIVIFRFRDCCVVDTF